MPEEVLPDGTIVVRQSGKIWRKYGWARKITELGLTFESEYSRFVEHLKMLRKELKYNPNNFLLQKRLTYTAVLLTQLVNGSRIYEAVLGLGEIVRIGRDFVIIKVMKQEKGKGYVNERPIVKPKPITKDDLRVIQIVYALKGPEKVRVGAIHYCRNAFGYNTHALRYLWMTWASKKGLPPQLIARITGHKRLDYVKDYVEQREAWELFKQIVSNL